ncbi:alpha/beta hydrolase [Aureisphaera galaxeae]|uniref:alpha/beta fold hydrolase n=1 Tax=Aureisphaera galaxeae TaxID=1538023 RepID=UPI0023503E88|nr:alpha/beta hydrolase [Aureisphaera galaxeae]MDC8003886.1 alpha/beta hydrolase [Aureisphaera galaxeae]
MKNLIQKSVFLWALLIFGINHAQNKSDVPYGSNEAVGKTVEINGVDMYYEEYGQGEPLLLVHGNGGSIKNLDNQIEYFKKKYRVIIADNRGHGKSGLKTDSLTYRQIANDLEVLVKQITKDSLHIVGTSDGAILGLLMGINNEVKIKRIVAWAGNLRPDTTAVHAWAPNYVKKRWIAAKKIVDGGNTTDFWNGRYQRSGLLLFQPNIGHEELKNITSPVLIMAGDRDVIKNVHSVEMYDHIPRAQLCIMPGATHSAPYLQPKRFNEIVDRFLAEPFSMPDSNWTKK